MNYFSLFGLPINYQVDTHQLMTVFHNLQRKYHPDKFTNCTKTEKLAAMQKSATINHAWQILRDRLMRAEYILSLHGFNFKTKNNTLSDTTFLTKQLELYKELDDIKQKRDESRLKIFIKYVNEMFNIKHAQMVEQLDNKKWDMAADTVSKLRFLEKIRISAEQYKEDLLSI